MPPVITGYGLSHSHTLSPPDKLMGLRIATTMCNQGYNLITLVLMTMKSLCVIETAAKCAIKIIKNKEEDYVCDFAKIWKLVERGKLAASPFRFSLYGILQR